MKKFQLYKQTDHCQKPAANLALQERDADCISEPQSWMEDCE
jgi:hypothetical protein